MLVTARSTESSKEREVIRQSQSTENMKTYQHREEASCQEESCATGNTKEQYGTDKKTRLENGASQATR